MDSIHADWQQFSEEFHRREVSIVYGAMGECGLVDQPSHEVLTAAFRDPTKWQTAFAISGGPLLFSYGLFAWGMKEWEYSIDHENVAKELDAAIIALSEAKERNRDIASHPDLPAVELIMFLTGALKKCMAVEDTLYSSCLPAFNQLTNDIVNDHKSFEKTLDEAGLAGLERPVRNCIKEIIQTQLYFYTALTYFGTLARDYQNGIVATIASHEEALRQLDYGRISLSELGPDVLASELLPYRRVLETLRERSLQSLDELFPAVQFEEVKLIYVYPFTIDGLSGRDMYQRVHAKIYDGETSRVDTTTPAATTGAASNKPKPLNGVPPRSVLEGDLTDLWKWRGFRPASHDDADNADYSAVDIKMPDLTVTAEDGLKIDDYRVTVRITSLGNHYLRIEKSLPNPTLHEINQGLRRASNLMCEPAVTCEGIESSQRLPNLTEYAKFIVKGLFQLFGSNESDATRTEEEVLSDIDVHFHVVLEIRSASIASENGGQRDTANEDQIKRFAGSLLLQPLTRMAVAPEEWVCFRGSEWTNILVQDSFSVDFAVGTKNTTVLSMPASPEWFYNSYEECIELVVSFPSLVGQWTHEMREKHQQVNALIVPITRAMSISDAQEHSQKFADIRRGLHDKIVDIRKRRMFLTPSELIGSGHHLAFMTNLFDIARISDLLKDLDAQLQLAELVHNRAVDHQRRLYEEEQRLHYEEQRASEEERKAQESRFGRTASILLIFIGSFALAGVVEMFDHQIFGDKEHILETSFHPGLHLALAVLTYFVLLSCTLWWASRQGKK